LGLVGIQKFVAMRTIKLSYPILLAVLLLFSCSKSDDDNEEVPANAQGVILSSHDEAYDTYAWINDYVVIGFSEKESVDINDRGFRRPNSTYYPYYPFTMSKVYELYSAQFETKVDESNFNDYATDFEVRYLKNHINTYKYVTYCSGNICLFNRISSVNY